MTYLQHLVRSSLYEMSEYGTDKYINYRVNIVISL